MKRFLYYIWFLPLMLSGCEKDLMDYEGLEGVYFAVQWGGTGFGSVGDTNAREFEDCLDHGYQTRAYWTPG